MYTRAWNTALYLKYLLGKWYASNCIHKMMGNLYTLSAGRSHRWIGFLVRFLWIFIETLCVWLMWPLTHTLLLRIGLSEPKTTEWGAALRKEFSHDPSAMDYRLIYAWGKSSNSTRLGSLIPYPIRRDKSFWMQTGLTLLTTLRTNSTRPTDQ